MTDNFKSYTDKLSDILEKKNEAYGNSFDESLNLLGPIAGVTRIYDKFNRIKNLVLHPNIGSNDEPVKDTLKDLAGYATLMWRWWEISDNISKGISLKEGNKMTNKDKMTDKDLFEYKKWAVPLKEPKKFTSNMKDDDIKESRMADIFNSMDSVVTDITYEELTRLKAEEAENEKFRLENQALREHIKNVNEENSRLKETNEKLKEKQQSIRELMIKSVWDLWE